MPPRPISNEKLPGSSSSLSRNESPTDEINYDSDISDDDNAIAEGIGDDGDDEEDNNSEEDEGFQVEVSTLTGSTFNVTIHPSDTVEVLKTRIAFQEGISPADQNLVLEQGNGKFLDTSGMARSMQELNIDRNSRLTLVTNVSSGVPFKQFRDPGTEPLPLSPNSSSLASSKLCPSIRRNYPSLNSSDKSERENNSSSSIRLPKISTTRDDMKRQNGNHLERLDEREWMQSLFDKVAMQEDGLRHERDEAMEEAYDNKRRNIDLTNRATEGTTTDPKWFNPTTSKRGRPNDSLRQLRIGSNINEEDGSILVVQGEDGVILIIQKNSGQVLDDYGFESGGKYDANNNAGHAIDFEFYDGRMPRMGKCRNGSRVHFKDNKVHDKIKENAVTLEKMRQVRSMMAKRNQATESTRPSPKKKTLEFPRIRDSFSTSAGISELRRDSSLSGTGTDNISFTFAEACKDNSRSGGNGGGMRSVNSSKMSLNRLIAEIYLQSRRKGHAFQPGQPPYTEQQLLKYVQLKVAILLDEQRKNNTEPCSKCQLDEDWSFDQSATYLVPTVVLNRYKRLSNHYARNSKSLEQEMTVPPSKPYVQPSSTLRRAMVPASSTTTATTISGRSSSSTGGGGGRRRLSTGGSSSKLDCVEENNNICDTGTGSNRILSQYPNRNGNVANHTLARPSYKVHPMKTSFGNSRTGSRTSSRPGSSSKGGTGKKGVRCHACRKKIGIVCRYQCRCGLTFCATHRYPEAHECTYDYKTEGRNRLRESNPVVVAPKVPQI